MSREDVLEFLNNIIEDNQGEAGSEDVRLVDTGIDSLGVAVVLLELDDEYGCYSNEYIDTLEPDFVKNAKLSDFIDRVVAECT